jgi:hypothetical protein
VLPAGQSLNQEGQWLISDLLPLSAHHALAAAAASAAAAPADQQQQKPVLIIQLCHPSLSFI